MVIQTEFKIPAKKRGCHLVTGYILSHLPAEMPQTGLLNIFVQHTSCGLTINENADPDVRRDMDRILDRLVPERQPYYAHTAEGDDGMPAHAKSSLMGVSLTIPVRSGRVALGSWQGIYLCEFRDYGGPRSIVLTVYG